MVGAGGGGGEVDDDVPVDHVTTPNVRVGGGGGGERKGEKGM